MVPEMLVMFQVPDWVAATVPVIVVEVSVTGIALWLEANTTGTEAAIRACPLTGTRVVKVASAKRVEVATSRLALVTAIEPVMVVEARVTAIEDWLDARTTGTEVAIVPWPLTGILAWNAEVVRTLARVASVAAPVGKGRATALMG
jgi:hypothetical protein